MSALLIARFAQTAAAVVFVGTLMLRLLALGTESSRPALRWARLVWGCWGMQTVASVGVLGLTAAAMADQTFAEVWQGGAVGMVLSDTQFGKIWLWRAGLLLAVFVMLLARAVVRQDNRWRGPATLDVANLLLAAGLLIAPAWTSHAWASARASWLLPANALHMLAAGAWPGGLPGMGFLLAQTHGDHELDVAITITRRFSRVCVLAVGFLAFSGLANAYGLVGTFGALWAANYGRLLLCKVTLFACMLGLGVLNRRRVRQSAAGNAVEIVRRLSRDVGLECLLAIGVILATEALALAAPPQ